MNKFLSAIAMFMMTIGAGQAAPTVKPAASKLAEKKPTIASIVQPDLKVSREDFQLQQELERRFTERLTHAYPSLRFLVVVKLKYAPPVDLTLIGDGVPARESSEYV